MNYIFTLVYASFFAFALYLLKRYYVSVISPLFVINIFILKLIAGIIYGWIHLHYYNGGDTYTFLDDSKILYQALHKNPIDFLRLIFGPVNNPPDYLRKYIEDPDFPTDASTYLMIRFNLLVLPFSRGYYNVHVVIYEFINVWGLIFLYKFFLPYLKGKDLLLKYLIFLLPSVLFWCSGVHKDGFALSGLGLLLYGADKLIHKQWLVKYLLCGITGAVLLVTARDFLFLFILPCLISYAMCEWFPKYKLVKWVVIHGIFFFVIFSVKNFYYFAQLNQHYDFLGYIMFKQNDFMDLTLSRANLAVPRLRHTYWSLISSIPYALNHCLFRPYIFELTNVIQYPTAIENLFIIFTIIVTIILFSFKRENANIFLFLLFYCFTQFVIIGITVTNIGALARYRTIGILLFMVMLLLLMNVEKLAKIKAKMPQFIKKNI